MSNYEQKELQSVLGLASLVSPSLEEDLIACQYDSTACTAYDFVRVKLDEFKTCYTFNSGNNSSGSPVPIRKVRRFGKDYGLHIEFFLGIPEKCKTPLSRNYGLVVYIHNSTYAIWDETNGFEIMSGYETDLAVDRTRLLKLPKPYSRCLVNTDPPPSYSSQSALDTFKIASSYTQQTCLQLCYQSYLTKLFKCFDPNLPFYNQTEFPPCNKGKNLTSLFFTDKVSQKYVFFIKKIRFKN